MLMVPVKTIMILYSALCHRRFWGGLSLSWSYGSSL